jgi:hypothetical protein
VTEPLRPSQLLESFCNAWQRQAEDVLDFARRQDKEIQGLRKLLQQANDRADYWHARAINSDVAACAAPPTKDDQA